VGSAKMETENILEIAKEIGLRDFIARDKEGIYKLVSTQGKKLPDNIRSKILLCRALLKSPLLLLLDDFRHILTKRESTIITNYLLDRKHPYTLIFRTSDEEVMKQCDRVLFMHEGRIIDSGSFDDISGTKEYKDISDQLDEL
jgi:ATP-binding cassette subfamily B protein